MATVPPEPARSSAVEPHKVREVAESFGADAERYNRARPSYPQDLIDRIIATSPGRAVLDVGCGTGIAARLFLAKGCTVLGVDPDPQMADVARHGGLEVEVSKIEDWDPAGRVFDAAVAGQAWHWVDPVAGAAAVARALRPAGRLTAFWNVFGIGPELRDAFGEVFRSVDTGLPFSPFAQPLLDAYLKGCDKAAAGMTQAGGFGEPEQWRFEWGRSYTRAEWLDVVPTLGGINRLPADKLRQILDGLGAAIDAVGGTFTVNNTTVAVTAARAA